MKLLTLLFTASLLISGCDKKPQQSDATIPDPKTTASTPVVSAKTETSTTQQEKAESSTERRKETESPLQVTLISSTVADRCDAYIGEGPAMETPYPTKEGEMSSMVMIKDSNGQTLTYLAGELKAMKDAALLIAKIRVNNPTASDQQFRAVDVTIADPDSKLIGVGYGNIPFAGGEGRSEKLKKANPHILPAGKTWLLTYAFSIPKDKVSLDFQYRTSPVKKDSTEIKQTLALSKSETPSTTKAPDTSLTNDGEKDRITTTASGLGYKILQKGNGPQPQLDDIVFVAIHGKLENGVDFHPPSQAVYSMKSLLPGVSEGLRLMNKGSKFRLFIPPSLGLGKMGRGPIGPDQTLIYELELLAINPPAPNPIDFFAKNAARQGVVTTASGLQYEVIKAGEGPKATLNDTVQIRYITALLSGLELDNSTSRPQPTIVPASSLTAGFREALLLMNKGAIYRFFIPPSLAYGEQGNGTVGPNESLIFSLELQDINPGAATPTTTLLHTGNHSTQAQATSVQKPPPEKPVASAVAASDPMQLFKEGYDAFQSGNLDLAFARFNEVIRLRPNFADAYSAKGAVYGMRRDLDHAIEQFSEAIRLNPKNAAYYSNRGGASGEKGDNTRAIQDLSKAISMDPKMASAFYNRGAAYNRRAQKGDYTRAISDFTSAEKLGNQSVKLLADRGWAYSRTGDEKRANADFAEALRRVPKSELKGYTIPDFTKIMTDFGSGVEVTLSATDSTGLVKTEGHHEFLLSGFNLKAAEGGKNDKPQKVEIKDNTWGPGAVHTLKGMLFINGYKFISTKENPMVFRMDREKGYVHLRGEGLVLNYRGEAIHLQ